MIHIDPAKSFQTITGLGSSLEPATCFNLSQLDEKQRARALAMLLGDDSDWGSGICMNLMRVSMGTPDFTGDPWYSYDDRPAGEIDPELTHFSIESDRRYILPVLKEACAENPELRFFASPWSPPGWMKTTGSLIGGEVIPEFYSAYARYFVAFIRAYEAEGIPIHAVTVQNEPGVDRSKGDPKWHYPSCHWTAEQERTFIRDHLGPALRDAGLRTGIWCYDHNFNETPTPDDAGIDYPRTILSDPVAAKFVAGVAFHGYVGEPNGMAVFHRELPRVPIHFTEGSVFGLDGGARLIAILRNDASSYNAWVTMLDDKQKPNNGPFEAGRTIIELDSKTKTTTLRFDYFLYGQFMKFIERGATRIGSESKGDGLATVAFRNPDGRLVLVVVHRGKEATRTQLECQGRTCVLDVPAEAVLTLVWKPSR
jgi:glucosylceramidase